MTRPRRSAGPRPTEPWTPRWWLALPRDGRRYEILDGALVAAPAAGPLRQDIVFRVIALLERAAPPGVRVRRGLGIVVGASLLAPDVVVLRAGTDGEAPTVGGGDVLLVVEVADGPNVTTARTTTPELLATAGVPAYWRVEPHAGPAVVLHRLVSDAYAVEGRLRAEQTQTLTAPFQVTVTPARLVSG